MPSLSIYVGANVRRLRVRISLSQAEFAELCDMNGRHIQRIERGKVDLHLSSLEILAKALRVAPQALLRPARLEPATVGRPPRKKSRGAPHE
jgi:transcriptional regulator with XRE-family HTH domain